MFDLHYTQYYNGKLVHDEYIHCNYARVVQLLTSFREFSTIYRTDVEIFQGNEFIMGAI